MTMNHVKLKRLLLLSCPKSVNSQKEPTPKEAGEVAEVGVGGHEGHDNNWAHACLHPRWTSEDASIEPEVHGKGRGRAPDKS